MMSSKTGIDHNNKIESGPEKTENEILIVITHAKADKPVQPFRKEKMADDHLLNEAKVAARGVLDDFTDNTIEALQDYIDQEDDIPELQHAFHLIGRIQAALTSPQNFGEMNEEGTALLNAERNDAVQSLTAFRDNTIPNIRAYIERETNIQNLQQLVRHLNAIDDKANPAEIIITMDRLSNTEFLNKAYATVDDPSKDSVTTWSQDGKSFIVWHPAEFCRVLGTRTLYKFQIFGFTKKESGGGISEFKSPNFVRGEPELLEKILERHVERKKAFRDVHVQPVLDRLKSCENQEEKDLRFREHMEELERKRKEQIDKDFAAEIDGLMAAIARERETREVGQDAEDPLKKKRKTSQDPPQPSLP
ncbi:unnamed protein product [Thlaspi arvense]|uniref:HSF-type DNA-binding domain-containing protein n=1 Tax=Thlaspi arvense TaxID=13288 RepID=A0AAU9T366_THLAR|nr:unnamed protein product [Thlaspi arvense]